ncbi:PQQ-dependent sugar dehydrogenase [Hymenobacter sp. AT01-02]|uniref:PQQ-dependent sugar dehydrogenase n=1 Tax=Hymenobacter sp. AT01-02 TaxID=1571877 RepID=UPI000698CE27|nr:PQQ-dependent sugar dehydrogenase [Hymenobacter sp. AT01-02]
MRSPSGRLYSSEHGPNNDDELNLIEANRNYGWPTVEGLCNLSAEQAFCSANNVREPLAVWTPTLGVSGLAYYTSSAIPAWQGSLLMLSLKASRLTQLTLTAAGDAVAGPEQTFLTTFGRLRAICVSPQGRVYVGTSNQDGRATPGPTDDRILVLENLAFVPTTTVAQKTMPLRLWPNPAQHSVTLQLPKHSAELPRPNSAMR